MDNIKQLYTLATKRDKKILNLLETKDKSKLIRDFLKKHNLPNEPKSTLALAQRVATLRADSLQNLLKSYNLDEKKIEKIIKDSYTLTATYHIKAHEKLLKSVKTKKLLNPFYRTLFDGVHRVGIKMNQLHTEWENKIILGINKEFDRRFATIQEAIGYFEAHHLLESSERTYSLIVKHHGEYKVMAYQNGLNKTEKVTQALDKLIAHLVLLEDTIYHQKNQWIDYLIALNNAFKESDTNMLLARWQEVDKKWMAITTPFQVGHPLEYYEDHYRKAVAIEWDIRLANPEAIDSSSTYHAIQSMYHSTYQTIQKAPFGPIYQASVRSLGQIQLYVGRAFLYYGASFNGLFSAQVVPNDEQVSSEFGKKIFAYSDRVLQSSRAKPLMKLGRVVFGDEYIFESRRFLFTQTTTWHKLYQISTIGHEYGHILWVDESSESVMNGSGMFKNIEEFKATTGGLMAFFEHEDETLRLHVLKDVISRSVGLIGWMEVGEVLPYYAEGLIHLALLFESGVLDFDTQLRINLSIDSYNQAKILYRQTYQELALTYLQKQDAKLFLDRFVDTADKNFMPKDEKIKRFVNYYYALYQAMGNEIDEEDSKSNYLS